MNWKRFFVLGGWFTWVALGAAAVSAAGSVIGGAESKPKGASAVQYTPVNLQDTQAQAITGDQANLGSLDQLLSQSNQFQQTQATQLMNQALPGYSQFASNLTNTASNLAANPYAIPQSVVGQLSQYAAENNISEGTGAASGFSSSNLLRSLGVNALQYGQANMASATSALSTLTNTAPRISPMSPASFMITPQQQAANQQVTNTNGQQINQGAVNSATAAGNAGSASLWDSISSGVGGLSTPLMQAIFGNNGQTTYPGGGTNPNVSGNSIVSGGLNVAAQTSDY